MKGELVLSSCTTTRYRRLTQAAFSDCVFDYPRALPQHDGLARPPLTGGLIGCHRKFEVLDAGNVLENLAIRSLSIRKVK
jgi:hypothetical protein